VDIVVKGRQVEVPEHFRAHVADKLGRVERLDHKIIRLDVELAHERNPRQSAKCQRVEITGISKGPKVRAEASSDDFYAALDLAVTKLEARLRRAADRRRVHHGAATPTSVAAATAGLAAAAPPDAPASGGLGLLREPDGTPELDGVTPELDGPDVSDDLTGPTEPRALDGGLVVRQKTHEARPMTLDEALHEMELVGHDFYLFCDSESGLASVVYRRRGYDYGVIRLVLDE
jgi:ribosomal subunit interface protein